MKTGIISSFFISYFSHNKYDSFDNMENASKAIGGKLNENTKQNNKEVLRC